MSYSTIMIIKIIPKMRKRGHHTICQTHGINKRICKKTCKPIGGITYPDWLCDDGPEVITRNVGLL